MIKKEHEAHVCPVELAGSLDNRLRRWLQDPHKILKPYVKKGMMVLDVGCGPGFFSIEIAKLLNGSGQVIAADMQEGMLEIIRQKVKGTTLEQMISLQLCRTDSINITDKVDLILAFYMVHEVPDKDRLFKEFKSVLKPDGKILIVEPKFHVTKKAFGKMLDITKNIGFRIIEQPKVIISRAVVLSIS